MGTSRKLINSDHRETWSELRQLHLALVLLLLTAVVPVALIWHGIFSPTFFEGSSITGPFELFLVVVTVIGIFVSPFLLASAHSIWNLLTLRPQRNGDHSGAIFGWGIGIPVVSSFAASCGIGPDYEKGSPIWELPLTVVLLQPVGVLSLAWVIIGYPASLVSITMRAAASNRAAAEVEGRHRRLLLDRLEAWATEGFSAPLEEAKAMADTVGLEALVKELEGRVARLRAAEQGLGELDTTEFPQEVQALRALLKDPGQVGEAERRLGELKALIQREGQRRRARRLLDEGVSLGNQGAALLAEGRHGEAQAPLGRSLERLAQAETALGDGDPRLLESIAANRRAVTTNLLRARLGEALARSQQGVAEFDGQGFDQAEAIFQLVRAAVEAIAQEAAAQELQEVADEAARHVQELDQNIEGCRIGRDAQQVEALVRQANARWEESEQAVGQRDLLKASDTLREAVQGLEGAFGIANRRSFQDVLPTINQLRQRVQGRLDEIYDALSRGVTVAPLPPMPVPSVRPKPPVVRAGESIPGPAPIGIGATPWDRVYEIMDPEPMGQGGYADVYLARRVADGVQVAFKVPRGLLAGERTLSGELLRDFQREADNWQRLNHPHIVQLYEHGGVPYPWLAMELMSGGSLTSRLGKLPVRQALDILIKVCRALEHAHSGGFVHRDLKPENILFSGEGEPKVSDWGLARHALFQSLSQGYSGTLAYSAPEQVEPDRFGPYGRPGDVFQLGIVLYETLTGRHPFLLPGEELPRVLLSPLVVPRRIADLAFNVAPPTSARAGLPQALDGIVLQALRRPPRERHREVYLLREALEPVLEGA